MFEKPIIKTNRLCIRPFKFSDLDTMHEYASDIENSKYMVYLPNRDIKETEQFLQRVVIEWESDFPRFFEFAVEHNGKHIGAVSIYLSENRQEGELGWIINKKYHNLGYATEAAKAILYFAISNLGVKKVVAHCDYRNKSSCRVMQKIGLLFERDDGIRRYIDNRDNDEAIKDIMYALIV